MLYNVVEAGELEPARPDFPHPILIQKFQLQNFRLRNSDRFQLDAPTLLGSNFGFHGSVRNVIYGVQFEASPQNVAAQTFL